MNVGLINVEDVMADRDQAMVDVEKALAGIVAGVKPDESSVDAGVDNIHRAGELSAKAFLDSMEEGAKRAEAAGQLALEMGQARKEAADLLAKDLREAGKVFAEGLVGEFAKHQTVAESQASMRKLVLGEEAPKANGKGAG